MRTIKALYIPVEGDVEYIEEFPDDFYAIKEKLGVQVLDVVTGTNATMYVDDEGLINGSSPNPRATDLYCAMGGYPSYYIAGDVLVVGPVNGEGYDSDVPPDLVVMATN